MEDNGGKPLTILGLKSQNVMGVKFVELRLDPDDGVVVIGGDNGQGKTSLINCVWFAIGGKPDVPEPIRQGQDSAVVELDLGDLRATRRWWRNKNTGKTESDLRVSNADGAAYNSPQKVLDALKARFGFDVFEFTRLDPKKQVQRLLSVLGIEEAAAEIEARRKAAYDERTIVNRELARLEATFKGQPPIEGDVPDEEVSSGDLLEELRAAAAHNATIETKRSEAESLCDRVAAQSQLIDKKASEIAHLEQRLTEEKSALANMVAFRTETEDRHKSAELALQSAIASRVDTAPIQQRLAGIEETNRKVRAKAARAAAKAEWRESEEKRVALEKRLVGCETEKVAVVARAVDAARLAVTDLAWDEDGLFVEGLPFKQCNTAKQIDVALALALHENPRLRVFLIADGEKLTPPTMAILEERVRAHGAQVWVEMAVTPNDVAKGYREVTVLMEDGVAIDVPEVSA